MMKKLGIKNFRSVLMLGFSGVLALSLTVGLGSCKPEVDPPVTNKTTKFSVDLRLKWGNDDAQIQIGEYVNNSYETVQLVNLSMMVSKMALMKEDSTWVDLGDGYQHFNIWGARTHFDYEIPPGKYIGMRIQLGLDSAINHGDPNAWPADHPLNTNITSLHWGWAGGYIFQAMDGRWRTASETTYTKTFSFHTATDTYVRMFNMPYNVDASGAFEHKTNVETVLPIEYHLDQVLGVRSIADGSVSHSSGTAEIKLMNSIVSDMVNNKVFRLGKVEQK